MKRFSFSWKPTAITAWCLTHEDSGQMQSAKCQVPSSQCIIIQMPLGLYISVPFCRTKCTYCNFASDVFSRAVFDRYIARVCEEIEHASETAEPMGGLFERSVDSVYLGGGTPTILEITELERLFVNVSQNFTILPGTEMTVECAPGTLSGAMVDTLAGCGVNRVS